ncbi:MAG: hypothetical protein ACE5OV_00265 [Candidatus Bathyarchaeia archaeon]
MKKALHTVKFEEMKKKTFEVILVTERLCEICDKAIDTRERVVRMIHISDRRDYDNLLRRAKVYDRAEVEIENNKIYFHDHDYPGDVHQSCVEKL